MLAVDERKLTLGSVKTECTCTTSLVVVFVDGIHTGAALPNECAMNLFTASDDVTEKLRRLPQSLAEAKNAAAHSAFIASALPEGIIDNYTK